MITKDFSWAGRDQRSFNDRFFQQLETKFPRTCRDMKKGWALSDDQESGLTKFSQTSHENGFAYSLYVLKYAPRNHPFKERARSKVTEFIDALRMNDKLSHSIEYYEDGISAFLKGNRLELKAFTQFCSAWEITPALIKKAFGSDDSGNGHEPI